ncbi:hypothetical protein [Fusobacterium varium]|uniref:hypothetical protein n=1 Tax=Fusobacterium varium TaxID=856 RepID=UPI00356904F9
MTINFKKQLTENDIQIAYNFLASTLSDPQDIKDIQMFKFINTANGYSYEYLDLIDTYRIQGKEYSKIVFIEGVKIMGLLDDNFNGTIGINY